MRNRYLDLQIHLFFLTLFKGKITFKKLWNMLHCSIAYFLKWEKSGTSPFMASIELWNECNAGCLFCRNEKGVIHDLNSQKTSNSGIAKGKMPLAMATDIIDQLKDHLLMAVLYTNGEPLLYHDLPQVIKFASDRKVPTMIATNGLKFTPENIKAILESDIDLIKIQLSGYTQDIYSVQIRYGQVEQLKENIRQLVKAKKEGQYKTIILIDYILYNYNRHQLPMVKNFCKELGVLLNTRPGNPSGGLESKEPPLGKTPLPLKMSCDWLWKAMQINWNGDVLQCCETVVWSNIKPYENLQPGKTKLLNVWNGPAAKTMRHTMTSQGRGDIPICSKCHRTGITFKW